MSLQSVIGSALLELGNIPLSQRGADYRIAVGLVKESQGYLYIKNEKQAKAMMHRAMPYLNEVRLNKLNEKG